jgi:BirA family biotin operon repressor/biotin-[acetyl-CoA-carboxylase] ligase
LSLRHAVARRLAEARGEAVSGEALARELGVSRAAVAKHVSALRALGFAVQASPRRGYHLTEWPDILAPEAVVPLLAPDVGQVYSYRYLEQCESTNTEAFTAAAAGAPHGLVVAADHQRAGRGRRGRTWLSPRGQGLTFSAVLRPELRPADAPPLTLACAVAVAEALEREAGVVAQVKWPNDLLWQGRKCCGILLEMSAEPERIDFVVVGVGLNLRTDPSALPAEIAPTVASLAEAAAPAPLPPRPRLLAALLSALGRWTGRYVAEGMPPVREAWRARAAFLGQPIVVHAPEGPLHAVAEDVDDQGALLVRDDAGQLQPVYAGDVSLRPR